MCRLSLLVHVTGLNLVVFCFAGIAAPPLVIAELEARRAMAEADAARARGERDLAAWRFGQLQKLRDRGHASWQEVARQQVNVASAAAHLAGAEQYRELVRKWQARVAKRDLRDPEIECVRLYMPGLDRLVAWLPADVASPELLDRHLKDLSRHHQTLSSINLVSAQSAVVKARQTVEVYSRLKPDDDPLTRARIQLRLAEAKRDNATASRAMADVVARRMGSVREFLDEHRATNDSSSGLAQLGTRIVDATSSHQLSRMVEMMATDHAMARDRLTLLEHQRDAAASRVDALQALAEYSIADRGELDLAKQLHVNLDRQLQQTRFILDVQRSIAGKYEKSLNFRAPASSVPDKRGFCEDFPFADANVVRHCLDLQQRKLVMEARHAGARARKDYLVERRERVQRISEQARAPRELDHLDQQLEELDAHLSLIIHQRLVLDREWQRFHRQIEAQRDEPYQLVQAADGALISRAHFELGEALVAAVGFVGQTELFRRVPAMYPYVESAVLLDCLSSAGTPSLIAATVTPRPREFELEQTLHRRDTERTIHSSGSGLATDGFASSESVFCQFAYELQGVHPGVRWTPRSHARYASPCGFRTFNPYETFPFGSCGQSILTYRCGFPTRSSFPYRSNYLYRTAFPAWKDRTIGVPESFRGARWQSDCCFD